MLHMPHRNKNKTIKKKTPHTTPGDTMKHTHRFEPQWHHIKSGETKSGSQIATKNKQKRQLKHCCVVVVIVFSLPPKVFLFIQFLVDKKGSAFPGNSFWFSVWSLWTGIVDRFIWWSLKRMCETHVNARCEQSPWYSVALLCFCFSFPVFLYVFTWALYRLTLE